MRTTTITLFCSAILTAPWALAQEPAKPEAPKTSEAAAADVADLIEKLGDAAYKQRRGAEQALVERGEGALDALRDAAAEHDDPEVRWRAKRLVERIEGGEGQARQGEDGALRERAKGDRREPQGQRPDGFGRHRDLGRMFDRLFERLERDFDVDVPRRSFFEEDFFKDLRAQMEDLQKQSQGIRIERGPDGVRVEIEEPGADGKPRKEVYEADDLEAFRKRHPEIARRFFGGGNGLRLQMGDRERFQGMPEAFWRSLPKTGQLRLPQGFRGVDPRLSRPQWSRPQGSRPQGSRPQADDGPKLGVYVKAMGPDLRDYLGLDAGEGLWVESVVEGGLAEALGVKARDVVLEIDGDAVGSPADVAAALREAEGKVKVLVLRKGEKVGLEATAPAAKAEKSGKLRARRKAF